jgi:hypothetical protein
VKAIHIEAFGNPAEVVKAVDSPVGRSHSDHRDTSLQ